LAIKDYYKIMGLGPAASESEIKEAYRKQVMQYHPDRHMGDPVYEERLKEINEAYDVLSDRDRKMRYDILCREPYEELRFQEDMRGAYGRALRDFILRKPAGWKRGGCMRQGFGKRGCGKRRWHARSD